MKKDFPLNPIRYFGTNYSVDPPVEYFMDKDGDIWSFSNDLRRIVGWIKCNFKEPRFESCMNMSVLDPNLALITLNCREDVEDLYSHGPSKQEKAR